MAPTPQTRREIRESTRRRWPLPAVITVLAVLALGAAAWFGKGLFTDANPTAASTVGSSSATTPAQNPSETPTTPVAEPTVEPTAEPTAGPTAEADPLAASVATCRDAWRLQIAARSAAGTVLTEWRQHLDIMNQLQAGTITLATAKAKWPATTAKAPDHIAAFHAADSAYTGAKKTCAAPPAGTTGATADALRTCSSSARTGEVILAKARAAISPWETHLKDQSHFKAGGVTAAKAEAMWRALWQKGLKANPPFFQAAAAGAKANCILPA